MAAAESILRVRTYDVVSKVLLTFLSFCYGRTLSDPTVCEDAKCVRT